MKIYNSLTRQKQEFEPLHPSKINIYTCGVTVYDECHIGHARSLYVFDVIRRYLEYKYGKDNVNFVRNITDIDDKIITRANELKIDSKELVEKYIDSYNRDLELLGIRKGILDKDGEEPRATKSIPDMIEYIKGLIEKGYAYEAGGDVYFNVRKFSGYGKLSGQSIEQMQVGARIEPTELKKEHLDFALWKKSKENEPSWDSPWGKGRPGWHIECSVMSQKFLKIDTLDIHGGGRDLIFPHHENEIAQSEALTGKPFARYWIHHGLLTINGQKMSKSLGNFVTVKDALKKYTLNSLKIFYLQAHYSSAIDFSEKNMQEAATALRRFKYFFFNVGEDVSVKKRHSELKGSEMKKYSEEFKEKIKSYKEKFIENMDDDFNTAAALSALFEIITTTNSYRQNLKNVEIDKLEYAKDTIIELSKILGLSLKDEIEKISPELMAKIQPKIKERNEARKTKDFKKADQIRDELLEKDIVLEDTEYGTIPRKRYKWPKDTERGAVWRKT